MCNASEVSWELPSSSEATDVIQTKEEELTSTTESAAAVADGNDEKSSNPKVIFVLMSVVIHSFRIFI